MSDISIQISAGTVAWYAAVISTLSLGIAAYNAWRDRARIRISYQGGWLVAGGGGYDPHTKYFGVTVQNMGRRTVAIGNVGIKLLNGSALLLAESINGHKRQVLSEEHPKTEFLTPEPDLPPTNQFYRVEVYDQAGRRYCKYCGHIPTIRLWWYKLSGKYI